MPVFKDCELPAKWNCEKGSLITMAEIMTLVNDLVCVENGLKECCDYWNTATEIKTLRVGDKLYLSDTGTAPLEVSRPDPLPDPIQTWMNHSHIDQSIYHNGTEIIEMYMNDVLVYLGIIFLELPQYSTPIDLGAYIALNNPRNIPNVVVTNNLVQPQLNSGDICALNVTLINNGEIQGLSSGGDGMILTCPLKLINNGWIRGAGGDGGVGIGSSISIPSKVGNWEGRASYNDNGPYVSGQISPLWCNIPQCGIHAYYNRFWYSGGGANSGAWVHSGGASGQEYWDTATAPYWGDQGRCHFNSSGFWCTINGGGPSLKIAVFANVSGSAGQAGNGGAGIGFQQTVDQGWSQGTAGTYSGPSSGFDTNGNNLSLPSAGSLLGTDGGHGGTWATDGGDGVSNPGTGSPGGNAIIGASFLTVDSSVGLPGVNYNGGLVA